MNFLAHALLSGNNDKVLVGNFMGDFIRGNPFTQLETGFAKGVILHRKIDEFTDTHPIVLLSKERLRPKYGHYSPVIVDIYYDHFLAKNWSDFSETDLLSYSKHVYATLQKHRVVLPDKTAFMLRYMMRDNWLYHYQFVEGIGKALSGMARRSKFDSKMNESIVELELHYSAFEEEFLQFFPELRSMCDEYLTGNL